MDALLAQMTTGLAVEGLAGVLSRSASELTDQLEDLDTLIATAIGEVEDVPAIDPALGGEALRPFLHTPEVAALIRRVYAGRLTEDAASIEDLKAEFVDLWAFHVGRDDQPPPQAGRLFDVILAACDCALATALDAGRLYPLEANAARRQRQLITRLDLLHSSIEALRSHEISATDVERFTERYLRQVQQREGTIVPPDFDAAPRVPINALYVESPLERIEALSGQSGGSLEYVELLRSRGRKVVLGNPGNGKTTLTRKLATDHAANGAGEPHSITPFRVTLKDYGARKQEVGCSLREFIEGRISSDYQLEPPAGAIEYLLSSGTALVILDGLDELLDTSYRREISADIESFATLYPSVPLLVTSREVGYAQAPLSEELFDTYRLAPFDEAQIESYVAKWFAREPELSDAERRQRVRAFMEESKGVPDLRSNPLMLALMCIVYKGEGYIPRNRPDVYERCATLLFDRWDRQRKIEVPLEIESHIRPAMQYLAYWIYTDSGLEAEIPESAIVAKTTEYLLGRRYDDVAEAETEAGRFVEFCAGRAWVFTDVGATDGGERLFNFTHRTFLEYFTAGYLVRANPDVEALSVVLLPHIERREWDVVAQLAYQMLDRNIEGAGEALIGGLLPTGPDPTDSTQVNKLAFAARALEFLVPPPSTLRSFAGGMVQTALAWTAALGAPGAGRVLRDEVVPANVLISLADTNPENLPVLVGSLCERLIAAVRDDPGANRLNAAELALRLAAVFPPLFDRQLIEETRNVLSALAENDCGVAVELVARGLLDLDSFIDRFGVSALFQSTQYRSDPMRLRSPLATALALAALGLPIQDLRGSAEISPRLAAAIGSRLLESERPWFSSSIISLGQLSPFHVSEGEEQREFDPESLSPEQWFGIAAILAALYEEDRGDGSYSFDEDSFRVKPARLAPAVKLVAPVFLAKKADSMEGEARECEDALGFDSDQRSLLQAWRAGRTHFFEQQAGEDHPRRSSSKISTS